MLMDSTEGKKISILILLFIFKYYFYFLYYFLFLFYFYFYNHFIFRSGIPHDQLQELHGNIYLEKCEKCKTEYFRKFNVMGSGKQHLTGRKCEKEGCDGFLLDSIIHFGENLPVIIFYFLFFIFILFLFYFYFYFLAKRNQLCH